jgi:protein-L-isoaspartate O-methyltransferase
MHSRDAEIADAEFRVSALVASLRRGWAVSDREFDTALYPLDFRARSSTFWTPVHVALRATELLVASRASRVLDVGSGAGKLCIIGAAATGALFVGVEQRQELVSIATAASLRARTRTARFFHRDFSEVEVETFDAIYLFNPFEENVWAPSEWFDDRVELSLDKARRDVEHAEALLDRARPGTRVVTYHGFGGDMPASYALGLSERCHTGQLELWIKR